VTDARYLSLSWHLRSPLQGRSYCAGRSLPDWLKEVRSLRGSVLFDNGRRRHFRTEEGRLFDADPIDLYAYHILAYDAMRLVGCVRVYRLVSNGFSCVTEQILGEKTFSEMLHKLGARRTETVEIGRWIVHPAYRASGRPAVQLAAASAALAITIWNASLVQQGIVVCSAGTGDGQDLMLARIGLSEVPTTEPINCDEFKDNVRVMYCINTQQLNPRFLRIMDEMAKTIGLTKALCKIQPLFSQNTEAEQLAPFRVGQ
jgi:N-acyl-L-homoserine lactone synthetase